MKTIIKVTSALSAVVALVSLVFGFRVLGGNGFFYGFALFSMTRSGTIMGFIGNLVGIALTVIGFGVMAYSGFTLKSDRSSSRRAFIWGCVMIGLCTLSLICSFFARTFNFGDIILTALPVAYTYSVFKTA